MKRPFLTFMAVVVIPASLAMAVALFVAQGAWEGLAVESGRRTARLAIGSLGQDLGTTVDELMVTAEPLPDIDTTLAAVRAALAGDTVTGLDRGESPLDVFVLFPDTASPTGLRFGRSALRPSALESVADPMEARIAFYADEEPWSATEPPPNTPDVDRAMLLGAAAEARGIAVGAGALVALDPQPGSVPRISALAITADADRPALSGPVRIVLGLVLLFSALAGWILLVEGKAGPRSPRRSRTALVSLSLVPALATVALLVQVDRSFMETAMSDLSRDLTRTVSVVERWGIIGAPASIHDVSGLHAVKIQGGETSSMSLPREEAALLDLPAPPPSFTTSGVVEISSGPHLYVARRVDRTGTVLVLAATPEEDIQGVRTRMIAIGVVLLTWLAIVSGVVLARRVRRPDEEPA